MYILLALLLKYVLLDPGDFAQFVLAVVVSERLFSGSQAIYRG